MFDTYDGDDGDVWFKLTCYHAPPRAYSRGFAVFSFLVVYSPPPGMQKETIPHPQAPDRHHISFWGYIFLRAIEPFEPDQGYGLLEIVGPAELRKREQENKTGVNWGEKGAAFFLPCQLFACPLLSRLPHYLRAWANTGQDAMRKLLLT